MADPFTNTYLTYSAKGLREDLSNIISDISPEATPFQTGCGRVTAKATLVEWQTDTLAAAVSTNVRVEGFDVTSVTAVTPTVRVGNYTNISAKDFAIAGTLDAVDKAGRASEKAYVMARKGAELKRDMEKMLLDNVGGNAGASTTTARQTATLGAWVKTNTSKGSGGGDPAYTSGVPSAARTDGTTRTFTEAVLTTVLSSVWTQGGNAKILSVNSTEKALVSAFAGVVTKNYNIADRPRPTAIIASADVYVGQFDTVSIVPNRFQRDRDGWILDYDYLDIAVLRPFQEVPLARTGDAEKAMILTEYALVVRNEKALGLCADLGG